MTEDNNRRQSLYSFEKASSSCVFSLAGLRLRSVRWNIDFVDNLLKEIARGSFQEGRVREVGGILFGTIKAEEDHLPPKSEITVCRFFPVSPQSLVANETALSDTIAEAEKIGLDVVGLYKTQLKLEPELRARDQTLAEQLLKVKGHFLLSISPGGSRQSTAELFFPSAPDGDENFVIAFPFDRKSLRRGKVNRWQSSTSYGLTSIFRKRIPTLALAACLLIAGVLTGVFYRRTDQAPKLNIDHDSFGLLAFSKGDHVSVIWDPKHKTIGKATFGTLIVQDGAWARPIIIDQDTLRKGYMAYYPLTKQVKFRLQVADGIAETMLDTTPTASLTPKIPVLPVTAKVKGPEIKFKEKRRQFMPGELPSKPAFSAKTQELPPPPLQNARLSSPVFSVPDIPITGPAPPLVAASQPAPTVLASQRSARVVYITPESDKRVFPRTPPSVSRLLTSTVIIHVKVKLNEKGIVVGAESMDQATGVQKYLSQLSVNAALRWHFTPARRNDSAASTETILEFRFTAPE